MKQRSLLLELALDIVIFITAAAICVSLTVHAYLTAQKSNDLTNAVNLAQTVAEHYLAGEDPDAIITSESDLSVITSLTDNSGLCIQIAKDNNIIYEIPEVMRIE